MYQFPVGISTLTQPRLPISLPHRRPKASVHVVHLSLHQNDVVAVALDHVNREALLVPDACAHQLVKLGESPGQHGVELALYPVTRPRKIEQVGDSLGSTDERVRMAGDIRPNKTASS